MQARIALALVFAGLLVAGGLLAYALLSRASARVGSPAAPHDETGHTWQHPDYALFQLIRDGVAVANCLPVDPEQMPRFRDVLTDAELVAVLSYIKSSWPDETRRYHDKVNMMYGAYNRAVGELIDLDRMAGG